MLVDCEQLQVSPAGWRRILEYSHAHCAVSVLHQQELVPGAGPWGIGFISFPHLPFRGIGLSEVRRDP